MTAKAQEKSEAPRLSTATAALAQLQGKPLQRDSLQRQIYLRLREALMSGEFLPEQSVSIRTLADALDTSTMPVREALTRLMAEGAFEMQPNRTMRLPSMTPARLREITEIRVQLEGMAAAKAAKLIEKDELTRLTAIEKAMRQAAKQSDIDRYLVENWHFHRTIYLAARSDLLLSLIEGLWLRVGPCIRLCMPDKAHFVHSIDCHRRALAALKTGNAAESRKAIVMDISDAASDMYPILQAKQDQKDEE